MNRSDYLRLRDGAFEFPIPRKHGWDDLRERMFEFDPSWKVFAQKASEQIIPKMRRRWWWYAPRASTAFHEMMETQNTLNQFPAKIEEYEAAGGQQASGYRDNAARMWERWTMLAAGIMAGAVPAASKPESKLVVHNLALTPEGAAFLAASLSMVADLRAHARAQARILAKQIKVMKAGTLAANAGVNRGSTIRTSNARV